MGLIAPEYQIDEAPNAVILKKRYDEDSFVDFKYQLGNDRPDIEYSSEIVISRETGFTQHGKMDYSFSLN